MTENWRGQNGEILYIFIRVGVDYGSVCVCVWHLLAGLGERTHTDVEAVAVDALGVGAAQRSQTVADQHLGGNRRSGRIIRDQTGRKEKGKKDVES